MSPDPVRRVYCHSEDLDGWLAVPNRPILPRYVEFLRRIQGLNREVAGVRHEIQVVLNSGKPAEYLECEAMRYGGWFVISGNGAAWRECGGRTRRYGPPGPDLGVLRALLGLHPDAEDVTSIRVRGRTVQVAVEGKRDADGDIVLSFFPEPEPVAHRWSFRGGTDRTELKEWLEGLIAGHELRLHVAPPHRDGAVDVLPLVEGRPVGKWTLPELARELFPAAKVALTHGGDAVNDRSAMEAPGVVPLTAANCPDLVEVVRSRGGVVAERPAPEGGALVECYAELARRRFYGPLSTPVSEICRAYPAGC